MQSSPQKQTSPLIKAILTGTGVAAGATLLLLTLSNLGAIAKRPIQDWAALAGMAGVIGTGAVVAHEKLTRSTPTQSSPGTRRLAPGNGPGSGGAEVAASLGQNLTAFEPGSEQFNQVLFASRDFLQDYSRATGPEEGYQPVFDYEASHAINQNPSASPRPAQLPESQQQALRIPLHFPDVTSEDEPESDTLPERDRLDSVPGQAAQAQLEDLDPIDWSTPAEPAADPFEALRRIGNSGGPNGGAGGVRQSA